MTAETIPDTSTLLREDTIAARGGDKARARELLRLVMEADDGCEMAWLGLASVAETMAERVRNLERVLVINPANQQALTALAATKSTASVARALLESGAAAAKEGDRATAMQQFLQATVVEPQNETASPFAGSLASAKRGLNRNSPREFGVSVPRPANRASTRGAAPTVDGGVVVIGASTGSPIALRDLLTSLPADFPLGIIVVQHMPASFTAVLAEQLNRQTALRVAEAREGDAIAPGVVLVAPGDNHMRLDAGGRVRLDKQPPLAGHRPSIDVTMESVAQVYGALARAVVLTGMGSDGTCGLLAIGERGGRTYAQDGASCVINGMPQRAIERGVIDQIAPPARIADLLRLDCEQTLPLHSAHADEQLSDRGSETHHDNRNSDLTRPTAIYPLLRGRRDLLSRYEMGGEHRAH